MRQSDKEYLFENLDFNNWEELLEYAKSNRYLYDNRLFKFAKKLIRRNQYKNSFIVIRNINLWNIVRSLCRYILGKIKQIVNYFKIKQLFKSE